MNNVVLRPYGAADRAACLEIFDANCPEYFAPNEREEYAAFLAAPPDGYMICELNDIPVGAFGLSDDGNNTWSINWILLQPDAQGRGIGSLIMEQAVRVSRASGARQLRIATSPRAQDFFAHFGARLVSLLEDGWGPGLDRVAMEIAL